MSRKLLAVVTDPADPEVVSRELERHLGPGDQVRVLASPTLSPLRWLTSDEDGARSEAESVAGRAAAEAGEAAEPAPAAGDPDPLQAAEDGLRRFGADEVLVVAPAGVEVDEARFARLGVPVRVVTLPRD